ncbi:hypothetical protein [Mesorhizobium sp. M2D.F.Ca.ET.153.01.1.1]|uniref:hypothetical protein n=1 Tax=Mesorhizobium sp. M2D.F.Ca.ET.153.01.1.1 TaxID=2500520 RepID=UPI0010920743|nr:hypothetical protein [Mesorhizobium sp. M2D.F.Ca.ET.153.01.1.1]TGU12241.1 hypothetical protein EN806_17615 [bacterium M00.F.Ca.ET.163.01.1.1]
MASKAGAWQSAAAVAALKENSLGEAPPPQSPTSLKTDRNTAHFGGVLGLKWSPDTFANVTYLTVVDDHFYN